MASYIKRGESILIPFRNGQSITDSQLKPRMYKTMQTFEKAFPKHYLGTNGVELVEYAEVVRCEKCHYYEKAEYDEGYKMVCRLLKRQTAYNGFCYCGERRKEK